MAKNGIYLKLKNLSSLLRRIMSKRHSDFCCLNYFHSFKTKNKFESHKKLCKNKDFYNIIMHSEGIKILEFNLYQKSHELAFIIYADLEFLIENINRCKNNPENSFAKK